MVIISFKDSDDDCYDEDTKESGTECEEVHASASEAKESEIEI